MRKKIIGLSLGFIALATLASCSGVVNPSEDLSDNTTTETAPSESNTTASKPSEGTSTGNKEDFSFTTPEVTGPTDPTNASLSVKKNTSIVHLN